jgi:hypothetical protein
MPSAKQRDGRFDRIGRLRPVVIERIGREAVEAAVKAHREAGRDVYYTDASHPGCLIRESPDGLRILVREDEAGSLRVVQELDSR